MHSGMRNVLVVAALATPACFSPNPATGVPCDPAASVCPEGQSCVAQAGGGFSCSGEPGTTPDSTSSNPDMTFEMTPDDQDADGILDVMDNCPTKANHGQENEDSDAYGDACDPCPPFADGANIVDTDNDGVSDACDPHPTDPGDKIFLFEGFANGIPATWDKTSGVTASNGDAVLAAAGNTSELAGVAEPAGDHLYVWSSVTFTAAGNGSSIFAVVDRREPGTDNTLSCQLVSGNGGNMTKLRLFSAGSAGNGNLGDLDHSEMVGSTYELILERTGNSYNCNVTNPDARVTAIDPFDPGSPEVGLRVREATATFHWLMVITSP